MRYHLQREPSVEGGRVPLSFFVAAVQVLRDSRQPLTAREITTRALDRGLLQPRGRTPEKTIDACLYRAVRDDPACPVRRVFEPGPTRARRGSVRWVLRADNVSEELAR